MYMYMYIWIYESYMQFTSLTIKLLASTMLTSLTPHPHLHLVGPPDPWASDDMGSCSVMLEAVSKLIEVIPKSLPRDVPNLRHLGTLPRSSVPHKVSFAAQYQIDIGISREGMWLLSNYCTPTTTVRVRQTMPLYLITNSNVYMYMYVI